MRRGTLNQIKGENKRKIESKKAKQRLNLINKTQISFTVLYDLVYELLRYSMYRKANDRKRKKANTATK